MGRFSLDPGMDNKMFQLPPSILVKSALLQTLDCVIASSLYYYP